jgi:hypothetical protein
LMTAAVAVGALLNVTVLVLPTGHVPENVPTRTVFDVFTGNRFSNVSGDVAGTANSAARTTPAIRCADSRVNCTASNG